MHSFVHIADDAKHFDRSLNAVYLDFHLKFICTLRKLIRNAKQNKNTKTKENPIVQVAKRLEKRKSTNY